MLDDTMKYIYFKIAKQMVIASFRLISTLNMIRECLTEKIKLKKKDSDKIIVNTYLIKTLTQ